MSLFAAPVVEIFDDKSTTHQNRARNRATSNPHRYKSKGRADNASAPAVPAFATYGPAYCRGRKSRDDSDDSIFHRLSLSPLIQALMFCAEIDRDDIRSVLTIALDRNVIISLVMWLWIRFTVTDLKL